MSRWPCRTDRRDGGDSPRCVVIVPRLAFAVPKLHEADAPLDEPARDERLPAVHVFAITRPHMSRLAAEVEAELRRHFGALVFTTTIPRSVRLAEAPSHGVPAIAYDRRSAGAEAYWKVAMELVERS